MWCLPASSVALWREGSGKEQWPLPAFLSGRKLPPAFTLIMNNSVPPCASLMFSNLLPLHWSWERVSLSKFVHDPYKRNCQGVRHILYSTTSILLVFTARSYVTSLPGTGTLGWGPGVGLGCFAPEISLPIFMHLTWV